MEQASKDTVFITTEDITEDTIYPGQQPTEKEGSMVTDYFLDRIEDLTEAKNKAYSERNQLIVLLTALYPSGIKRTDIPGWLEEWKNCVYIDTPTGQMSWHYHDKDKELFQHLPPYEKEWDGHTTEQKYQRFKKLCCYIEYGGHKK